MKKRIFLLFFSFILVSYSYAFKFKIIKDELTTGRGFLVEIKGSKIFKYEVIFDKKNFPVYEYKNDYVSFIPVPVGGAKDNTLRIKKMFLGINLKEEVMKLKIKIKKPKIYHLTKKDEEIRLKEPMIKEENKIIKKIISSVSEFQNFEKDFIFPLKGKITAEFGLKRIGKNFSYFHEGIDIYTKKGTKIKAASSGKIILSGKFNVYGNLIIIDHGLGVKSCYFHLNKIYKNSGDIVKKGEDIGEVGETGWATGPHLHFGIYLNGIAVDPFWFISFLKNVKF